MNAAYVSADLDLPPGKVKAANGHAVTSVTYEDVNDNRVTCDPQLTSALKKSDRKRCSRVSFKLDSDRDGDGDRDSFRFVSLFFCLFL